MIAIDTNVFIYHLISQREFGAPAKRLFVMLEEGEIKAVASVITYAEIITLPAQHDKQDLVTVYQQTLTHYPNLRFIAVDIELSHQAALLRGHHPSLKMMDAVIVATACKLECQSLITEDERLHQLKLPIPTLSLHDFFKGSVEK